MPRSPQEILEELSQLDFAGRGEAFVESRFITPLLEALGYETHRDYEVIRHGDNGSSFKLRYPPVEGGAKSVRRYNPDFIPTIRKKMFWIVEAKTAIEQGYPFVGSHIVQGLQYCIHPEIQAKYLLLTNGRHSAIYDAYSAIFLDQDIYEPIMEFESGNIISAWDRIHEILSVERLRGRIELDLKSMYDRLCLSSLDAAYPHRLLQPIGASRGDNVRTIESNVRRLYLDDINKAAQTWKEHLDSLPSARLGQLMDAPVGVPPNIGSVYFCKQLKEGRPYREIADAFLHDFDMQTIFRKEQVVLGLIHLYQQPNVEADLKHEIFEFFERILDNDLPPLSQVECALLRINRKGLIANIYPRLRDKITASLTTAPEVIRFALPPTAFMSTIGAELATHERIFEQLKSLAPDALLRSLPVLAKVEEDLDPEFRKARDILPNSEKQIGGFETYGVGGKHWRFAGLLRELGIIPPRSEQSSTTP